MLQTIIGYCDLSLERLAPENPLHDNLLEILKAAQRSADLTRQLLAFARKQTAIPKELDLNETIAGMLKMLHRLIGEEIELVWIPGHDLWKVKVDPSQIDQILANLTVNARDAIGGVGKIVIESVNAVLDAAFCAERQEVVPGDYVRITVSDTGVGMDRDTMATIFEPFFTTKGIGKGTGLGLATVYGIVKQNDGYIDVASEIGRGAKFTIYLPRCQSSSVKTPAESKAKQLKGGRETLLMVEDENTILNLGKTILEQLGYTVLSANDPLEAIRLVQNSPQDIHLLITDLIMPKMNGRDLARTLTTLIPGLKCLFMSGYTANVMASRGILESEMPFIQKPFKMNELADKVREVLER